VSTLVRGKGLVQVLPKLVLLAIEVEKLLCECGISQKKTVSMFKVFKTYCFLLEHDVGVGLGGRRRREMVEVQKAVTARRRQCKSGMYHQQQIPHSLYVCNCINNKEKLQVNKR